MSETVNTVNPTTEQPVAEYTLMSEAEANQAVDSANTAFLSWKKTSFAERAELMNNLADQIEKQSDAIIDLMVKEMGKVVEQGKQEVELCAAICRYTAENGASVLEDENRVFEGGTAIITYQPLGVILGIQPWNFPLYQVMANRQSPPAIGSWVTYKYYGLTRRGIPRFASFLHGRPEEDNPR